MNAHARPEAAPALRREDSEGIAVLTLDRPQSRNPLSEAMLAALAESFTAIAADRSVKAVVLAAEGPVFCAGHDLKEMSAHRADPDRGRAYFTDVLGRCSGVMQQITALPQPVIAAVEGTATAAGCQLVAACDLAVASTDAKFATPGVNIGLFCGTPSVSVGRNVGPKRALDMLFTGEFIDAETALRDGLVSRVVPLAELDTATMALANRIAAQPPQQIAEGKAMFHRHMTMELGQAYAYATDAIGIAVTDSFHLRYDRLRLPLPWAWRSCRWTAPTVAWKSGCRCRSRCAPSRR